MKLATDIFYVFTEEQRYTLLTKMLKKRDIIFKPSFDKLTAGDLLSNWDKHLESLRNEKE